MSNLVVRTSKYLSLILRHKPEEIGLVLDSQGWANIQDILDKVLWINRPGLDRAVAENNKKRFEVSEDGTRIRAVQGHSIKVDLEYEPRVPPAVLYHGTYLKVAPVILVEGLKKMKRLHVHLSGDEGTAVNVGGRRGHAVVFLVDATRMIQNGHTFFQAKNGVWLTDHVPPQYLTQSKA